MNCLVLAMLNNADTEEPAFMIGFHNSYDDGFYWSNGAPVTIENFNDGEPNNPSTETCGGWIS